MHSGRADIAILGGGHVAALTALVLARRRPGCKVMLITGDAPLGGPLAWAFSSSDLNGDERKLIDDLVESRWRKHEVRFTRFMPAIPTPLQFITDARLAAALAKALGPDGIITGIAITAADADSVTLADGRIIGAGAVIDARAAPGYPHLYGGWRKYHGQILRLEQPHALVLPLRMDGRVKQADGFRYVTTLPMASDIVFVEDCCYSDNAEADPVAVAARIDKYCRSVGWQIAEVLGEHSGAAPVVAGGDFAAFRAEAAAAGPVAIGPRAGLFHPLTGEAVPLTLRTALTLAALSVLSPESIAATIARVATTHWRRSAHYRGLARMLLGSASTKRRYKFFEGLYRSGTDMAEHTLAGTLSPVERLRGVAFAPPLPHGKVLRYYLRRGRAAFTPLGADGA